VLQVPGRRWDDGRFCHSHEIVDGESKPLLEIDINLEKREYYEPQNEKLRYPVAGGSLTVSIGARTARGVIC
jgi:hypothetical protein